MKRKIIATTFTALSLLVFSGCSSKEVTIENKQPEKYEVFAKIGVTWTLVSEILGHQNHFYLDTKIGRHLDTFLDTPMKKIILS